MRLDPVFDFIRTLWSVNHGMQRSSKHMMKTMGLTGPQRMVLRIVGSNSRIPAGVLAETLHIHPGTLSSALRRLERRRLLTRTLDPRDRRRVLISLTESGRAQNMPLPHTIESGIRKALAQLPARDVAAAQRVLQGVAQYLGMEVELD